MAKARTPGRTPLLSTLLFAYVLLIVYGSLSPFTGWQAPANPFFVIAPWPRYITRIDLLTNVAAYLPLGALIAGKLARSRAWWLSIGQATLAGAALSFIMETLQMFLPDRDASVVDLIANTVGTTLGGLLALVTIRQRSHGGQFTRWRYRWFPPGRFTDVGIALLVLGLFSQWLPLVPALYVDTFYNARNPWEALWDYSVFRPLLVAMYALAVIGLGTFGAVVLKRGTPLLGTFAVLFTLTLLVKIAAAFALLKLRFFANQVSPEAVVGLLVGLLALSRALKQNHYAHYYWAATAITLTFVTRRSFFLEGEWRLDAGTIMGRQATMNIVNFGGFSRIVALYWPLAALLFLAIYAVFSLNRAARAPAAKSAAKPRATRKIRSASAR